MKNLSEDHKEIQSGKKLDDEGYMAKVEMDKIEQSLEKLRKIIKKSNHNLPAWVQSKITKSSDYLDIVADYLASDVEMKENTSFTIDKKKHKKAKSSAEKTAKIQNLTQSPNPNKAKVAKAKLGTQLPPIVKEETSLVDKILSEMLGDKPGIDIKKTKSLDKIAKKHKVSVESLEKQLKKGIKIEMEHTTDRGEAEIIALHHLDEIPDYYNRLSKMEGEAEMEEAKKYMTKDEDPCWKGYEMVGFKKKRGKKVPNCVPVSEQQSNQAVINALQNQTRELEARKKATQSRMTALKQQKNTGATSGITDISTLEEATTRLPMKTGQLLRVLVNWRGKHLSVQMFFPQLGTPKRNEITYAVNQVYPEARVISYVPCEMDSSTPIVQVKEEKGDGDSTKKPLNKITRTPGEPKKFKVYVKNEKTGNIEIVRFGDPNMEIKRDDPDRLAAFRSRHNCDNATDKTTPKYWSCKQWRPGKKVED